MKPSFLPRLTIAEQAARLRANRGRPLAVEIHGPEGKKFSSRVTDWLGHKDSTTRDLRNVHILDQLLGHSRLSQLQLAAGARVKIFTPQGVELESSALGSMTARQIDALAQELDAMSEVAQRGDLLHGLAEKLGQASVAVNRIAHELKIGPLVLDHVAIQAGTFDVKEVLQIFRDQGGIVASKEAHNDRRIYKLRFDEPPLYQALAKLKVISAKQGIDYNRGGEIKHVAYVAGNQAAKAAIARLIKDGRIKKDETKVFIAGDRWACLKDPFRVTKKDGSVSIGFKLTRFPSLRQNTPGREPSTVTIEIRTQPY